MNMKNITQRRFLTSTVVIAVASMFTCGVSAQNSVSKKPNVILIMADDMGFEAVSAYGSKTYATPNVDKLAERGVRFNNCFSTPICTPSRVKIMTGQYSFDNYTHFGKYPVGSKSIGNLMSDAGYATACFGKWQLGGARPTDLGFDEYLCANGGVPGVSGDRFWGGTYGDHNEKAVKFSDRPDYNGSDNEAYGPDLLLYRTKDFISRQAKSQKAFFVYYPMVLTHWPFVKTPDSVGHKGEQGYFEDMVQYADKITGEIIAHVDSLGLTDNTLIIFTGDNGSYPGLVGRMGDNSIWEGAKSTPIRPGQHVPLIAAFGKNAPSVSDEVVDFTDILPTLAEAAGSDTDLPQEYNCHGRSILPTITGKGQTQEKKYTINWYPSIGGRPYSSALFVSDMTYKLYHGGILFNIKEDPFELNPLYAHNETPEGKEARAGLEAYLNECIAKSPTLKKTIKKPRIIATWRDKQIPQEGKATLEWDITPHLLKSAGFVPGEFTVEAVEYYGFSRLALSNPTIYHNGKQVAISSPETGITQYSQRSLKTYGYIHSTGQNLFKFDLPEVDETGEYTLRMTFSRESFEKKEGLNSQANGYFFIHKQHTAPIQKKKKGNRRS
jgi:arylsulfatase A